MSVEAMMSQWRMMYGEWCSAELDLRQARNGQKSSVAALAIRAALLEQHCRSALDAIDAALAEANRQEATQSEIGDDHRPSRQQQHDGTWTQMTRQPERAPGVEARRDG